MKWWQDYEEHLQLLQDLNLDQDRDEDPQQADHLQADQLQHDEEEDKIFFFFLFFSCSFFILIDTPSLNLNNPAIPAWIDDVSFSNKATFPCSLMKVPAECKLRLEFFYQAYSSLASAMIIKPRKIIECSIMGWCMRDKNSFLARR